MLKLWWQSLLLAGVFSVLFVPIVQVEDRVFAQSTIETRSPITVTGVRLSQTDSGLEVVLETNSKQPLSVLTSGYGKTYVANITNAQLSLPEGKSFRQENPTASIAVVSVTPQANNGIIRVTAIGSEGLPTAKVRQSQGSTMFSLTAPSTSTAQTPTPTPPPPELETPTQLGETAPEVEGETPAPPVPEPADRAAQKDEQIEILVTGEQDGYHVPDTNVGTRTDTPLRDIPQSIQIIPQQVLEEQQVNTLNEAIKNVPGATQTAPNYIPGFAGFTIRGFSVGDFGPNVTRNGLSYGVPAGTQANFSDIERIEVLRGPASVLFGQGDPGGTINIVSKQPLRDPFYSIEATVGSYNRYGGAIDLTGPLNDSKTALYRLNASYEEAESFVDFVEPETSAVAGALTFELGTNTDLKFDLQYNKINQSYPSGLPAVGTVLDNPNGEIKRDRNFSSEDSEYSPEVFRVGYDLEHRLSENWKLRNAFYFSTLEQKIRGIGVDSLDPDLRTLQRQGDDRDYNEEILDLFTNVVGKFSTGAIDHQLLFGVDLRQSNYTDVTLRTFQGTPIDIFNPVYSSQRLEIIDRPSDNEVSTDSIGIYLQDQVTLADNFKLLLGGRFDAFEQTDEDRIEDTEESQSGDAFSPRLGVVYQPIKPISLYASYTRSFAPSFGRSFDDEPFEPSRGTQYEVGVKADINDRLSATLALYDLTRTNVNTADPDNPGFDIQTGEQNSQGFELFVSGEILPGWNMIVGYAYTDAQITADETFEVGNRINNVAESSFNVWTSYEIQTGNLQGLGFGLGFFYVGDRQGDLDNSFTLPNYFRTDAAIFYNRDQFKASLNIRNLFDVDYFESAYSDLSVYPAEPFTILGSIGWEF